MTIFAIIGAVLLILVIGCFPGIACSDSPRLIESYTITAVCLFWLSTGFWALAFFT